MVRPFLSLLFVCVISLTLVGCASVERNSKAMVIPAAAAEAESELHSQIQDLRKELTASNLRVESLETRISTLNDQIKAVQAPKKIEDHSVAVVEPRAADQTGEDVPAPSLNGYTNDENIQNYRQALTLYQAKKFPDAILAFSTFVERSADHPLAGNAQFYVGDSYLQQQEPKLALQEFQRVLTSYDRSPLIARTLLKMAEAEDSIQNPEAAAKYRQLLLSLFPTSPAAGDLRKNATASTASAASVKSATTAATPAESPPAAQSVGSPAPSAHSNPLTAPINVTNEEASE